jgi:hypothetical protein
MIDEVKRVVSVLLFTFLLLVSFVFAADEDNIIGLWNTPENDSKLKSLSVATNTAGESFG